MIQACSNIGLSTGVMAKLGLDSSAFGLSVQKKLIHNRMQRTKRFSALSGMLGAALAITAHAGEKTWDFETDPFEEFPFITSTQ
ncbi:MAG: hypothetical protein ACO3PR_10460, partial [Limisphaerales bacterium]